MAKRVHGIGVAVLAAAALAACGGGGGGAETAAAPQPVVTSTPAPAAASPTPAAAATPAPVAQTPAPATQATQGQLLRGTVTFGAPLAGASVTLQDAAGRTVTVQADANGTYSADTSGFVAPVLATATGRSGDAVRVYRALLNAPLSGSRVMNVTPLTDAIVALASSDGSSPAEFNDTSRLRALDAARLAKATDAVKAALREVATATGDAAFDPVTTAFAADRQSAGDRLLDAVKVNLSEQGVTLHNALVPLAAGDSGAAAASLTLKNPDALVTTPLPRPAVTDSLAVFDNFLAQANACLALAPEQRVLVDSVGTPSAFAGACAGITGFSANYRRNGLDLLAHWGHQLRNVIPAGAVLSQAEVLGMTRNAAGDELAIVRLAFTSPAGGGSFVENARRIGGQWAIEGNQRNYDAGVSVRLQRASDVSTHGYVPGSGPDKGKNVGRFSATSARLQLHFNQAGPNARDVYAVRVKGPGLPTAGVVLARSSSCGTGNYLAFYSNNGSLPAAPALGATLPMPTSATANAYTLRVAPRGDYTGTDFLNEYRGRNADGSASTAVTNPVAAQPVDLAGVPQLARYTFEVFKAGSSAAAETFTVRSVTRPVAPEFADKLQWAELSAESRRYADPADAAKAAALDGAQLSWTLPAGASPVASAYLWGSGFDNGTPPVLRRMNMGDVVRPFGASTVGLKAAVETNGNGNKCGYDKLPAFEASKGGREVGTRQVQADGLVLQNIVLHNARPAVQ